MSPSTYDATATASGLAADFASEVKGKVVLTTGVSPGGLGAVFAQSIAKSQPRLLILAGRNPSKVQETVQAIQSANASVEARVLELDLGSLAGARKAAETVLAWDDVPAIDVLVNNAGIMAVEKYQKTVDGYESQFATNHLAHFLFTNLIMKKLLAAGAPRVVNVSSDGHRLGHIRFNDYNFHVGSPPALSSPAATDRPF